MERIADLFSQDLIFFESAKTKEELFNSVGTKLFRKGLVKSSYIDAVIEREIEYPTGLDLSIVSPDIPNVAIPHTDTEHCLSERVVVVKLDNDITFNNMISPDKKLNVKFAFFILNSKNTAQTNILSNLMEFFTQNNNVEQLSQLNSAEEIYQYIQAKLS